MVEQLFLFEMSPITTMYAHAVSECIHGPVGLYAAHGFWALGLFLGRKSKIYHEQNVKEFQFYIRMPNFKLLGSIIKNPQLADPIM